MAGKGMLLLCSSIVVGYKERVVYNVRMLLPCQRLFRRHAFYRYGFQRARAFAARLGNPQPRIHTQERYNKSNVNVGRLWL